MTRDRVSENSCFERRGPASRIFLRDHTTVVLRPRVMPSCVFTLSTYVWTKSELTSLANLQQRWLRATLFSSLSDSALLSLMHHLSWERYETFSSMCQEHVNMNMSIFLRCSYFLRSPNTIQYQYPANPDR